MRTIAPATTCVLRLAPADVSALQPLRLERGVEVRCEAGGIWIRLHAEAEEAARVLGGVPALERFTADADDLLRHRGGLVPRGKMPAHGWQPLREWLAVEAPPIFAPAGTAVPRAALRLRRGGTPLPTAGLLVSISAWVAYAENAPRIRLQQLRYATSRAEGRALLFGDVLPPLPGTHFVAPGPRILVPAGFTWAPAIDAAALRSVAQARPGDFVWWREEEGLALLDEALFVPAARAGIRQLREAETT